MKKTSDTTITLSAASKQIPCILHFKSFRANVPLPALSEVFSRLQSPSILGANASTITADGFSYFAAQPREIFEFHADQKEPFEKLQASIDKYALRCPPAADVPAGIFLGGWIGFFAYELGRFIEHIPHSAADDLPLPLIRLCFYDRHICYDHNNNRFLLFALQLPDDTISGEEKLAALEKLLLKAKTTPPPTPPAADIEDAHLSETKCNMDKAYYLSTIKKIKRYIYDGTVYQVNFSQRFEHGYAADTIAAFHWQNQYNPSPYSAYINADNFAIVSASPEMFITINNGTIRTKPIKGTRPRISDIMHRRIDEDNFSDLVKSPKDQAELNMIIDLERNDLGRICRYGTIKVTQPRTIEIYPTVFHAVATIEGKLKQNTSFSDVLKAMFPGGSITGAPKISSMKIIDETEPTARSVYTGSIGYIGVDGNVSLNIAIRTIIISNRKAYVQTGGGIVADSDPVAEWDETLTKARALLAGIKAVHSALPYAGER